MPTPTNTVQIGSAQPNTGAAVGGKIPFGLTNQSQTDEKFITLTVYKRASATPISVNTVLNLVSLDNSVQGEIKESMDQVGQTGNTLVHNEAIQIEVTALPQGSTLGDGAATDALKGANLPPLLAFCKISNAPVMWMGFVNGSEAVGTGSTQGDALNSQDWQVRAASNTMVADNIWGVKLSLKRYKSPAMRNPNAV